MKKFLVGASVSVFAFGMLATVAFAATPSNPGSYGTANPAAQCGTAAMSGAFNAHNAVYGQNSSAFGQAGGAGVNAGPVGQQSGATGARNSAVCGH